MRGSIRLGIGFLEDGPVWTDVPELDAEFKLIPLDLGELAAWRKAGVKTNSKSDNPLVGAELAAENNKTIMTRLVHDWRNLTASNGSPIPFSEENRSKLAMAPLVAEAIIGAATKLAVERDEADEGNSES